MHNFNLTNLHQWFECDGVKFNNLYNGLDHSIDTQQYCFYHVDPFLIESLQGIKRPKTDPSYIQSLMIKQLKKLRSEYEEIRLLYTGGTDSFTILKLAMDNGIYIDETITHLVSFTDDPKSNIEYLPGLQYAKQYENTLIGKVTTITPKISDLDYLNTDRYYSNPNYVRGSVLWIRPVNICQWLPTSNKKSITLTGHEKPQLIRQDGKLYWCMIDKPMDEFMDIPGIYHFFYDKNNPELMAAQIYATVDNIPNTSSRFINFSSYNTHERSNMIEKIGLFKTGRKYIDDALLGKGMHGKNIKNRRYIKELHKQGRSDIVDRIKQIHTELYNYYQIVDPNISLIDGISDMTGKFSEEKVLINQDFLGA